MKTDRLLIHAIEALYAGDRTHAGAALARLVRLDPSSIHAWWWLSVCVEDIEHKRYCLERILSLAPEHLEARRQFDALVQATPLSEHILHTAEWVPPADALPVTLFAAGVKFDNRPAVVSQLHLRQPIWLRREPDNTHDPSAIRLETRAGAQFGFVRKEATPFLAPYMDENGEPLEGIITELFSDLDGGNLRVGVAFYLPEAAIELQDALTRLEEGTPEIAWFLEQTPDAVYLLIDGSEEDLRRARRGLQEDGIAFTKYGVTFHPASDGCFYNWYLHLADPRTEESRIKECLEQRFEIRPSARAYHEAEEMAELFDADREKAIERLNQTLAQLSYYEQASKRLQRETAMPFDRGQLRDTLSEIADDLRPEHLLRLMACLFSDRVIILDSAYEAASEVPRFERSKRLFDLLWKLAVDYPEHMRSGKGNRMTCEDLFGGDAYAAQDDDSSDYYRQVRTFSYAGKSVYMPEHLKIGKSFNPNETLRVHFRWMNEDGKVVIGHCGKHLPQQA
ncbi:MAG: HIRAN domain-containing protein [Anaerolineae bacterium]